MQEYCCQKCKFWDAGSQGADEYSGSCRRKSPVLAASTESLFKAWAFSDGATEPDDYTMAMNGLWPQTSSDDWCGDFKSDNTK